MKLGTQTASVINHLYSRGTIGQPTPTVGMGATILMWTDRAAGTIVSVEATDKRTIIGVQRDTTKVTAGTTMDGSAEYEYAPNPKGRIEYFRAEGQDGAWRQVIMSEKGRWRLIQGGGNGLKIGVRDEYRDPSF